MSLEISKTTPMMAQWAKCKSESEGSLLLFRLGDFYEAFHDDAITLSQVLDLTLTKRQEVPMCGIPWHASEGYIDRLLQKGFSVAIAEQVEGNKLTDKSGKIAFDRKVVKIVSPGTSISHTLLQEHSFHYIASLYDDAKSGLGLALIDMSTGVFQVLQAKNEKERKDLLVILIQRKPKEIVFSKQFLKNNSPLITDLESHLSFRKTGAENWLFDTKLAYEVLKNHFKIQSLEPFGIEDKHLAIAASGALLAFIRDTLFHNVSHLKKIEYFQTRTFMQIDLATMKNLDLFEVESKKSDAKSLYSILNCTKTPMGARLLRSWLLQPLITTHAIQQRQEEVEQYRAILTKTEKTTLFAKISSGLSQIRDLERLIQKIGTQTVSPRDIRFLASCITGVLITEEALRTAASQSLQGIPKYNLEVQELTALLHIINTTLVEEPPLRIHDGEVIMRGINSELDEIKELKLSSESWLLSYQQTLREELGIKNAKIGFTRAFGYYIEISKNYADKMPSTFSRRQTLTSGERYISEELLNFERKILSAESQIQSIESTLFQKLIEQVRVYQDIIIYAAQEIGKIDLLLSFAKLSLDRKYIRPCINESIDLEIYGGRHPIAEEGKSFIANDVLLHSEGQSFALITGPNMGGKSTYIRMSALLVIMAQIGSFIPAQSATIGIVDTIMSRIGASDDLASGQSTFMVEMTETAHILHTKTPRTLILLDEIGRGTSTFDGLSIAWAVTEHLTFRAPFYPRTLFTTHYHELTTLQESIQRIKNMTVAVCETSDGISFLYKVIPGKADKSYGIHVAKLAGIPEEVLQRANHILSYLEDSQKSEKEKSLSLPNKEDLFDHSTEKKPNNMLEQAEKALSFIQSLDLIKLTPLDCFTKIIRFQESLLKEKKK